MYVLNKSLSQVLNNNSTTIFYKLKCLFGNVAYFNLITYTTLGYGDIRPTGLIKIIAGIEGFIGVLLNSIFLMTLTRKILR